MNFHMSFLFFKNIEIKYKLNFILVITVKYLHWYLYWTSTINFISVQ